MWPCKCGDVGYVEDAGSGRTLRATGASLETEQPDDEAAPGYTDDIGSGRWLESVLRDDDWGRLYGWHHNEVSTATVYLEGGRSVYAIAGAGRTNLNPYWNLGFDPNDYVQFGGGYRDKAGTIISAFAIHDNRLGTGQTNTRLYYRRYLPHRWRLTFEVVRERGTGDEGLVVRAWSTSADVDWRR
jgi:hypothetical protein